MPQKKPVTTKRGQHHKFKSFIMNLVKDNSIEKVDTNVVRKHPESFEKKTVKFEKRNSDPAHFRDAIYQEFPTLSGVEFSLWRLSKDNPTLIPLPSNINNAVALCSYDILNRSNLYIRLMAAPTKVSQEVSVPSDSSEMETDQNNTSDTDDETKQQTTIQNSLQLRTTSIGDCSFELPKFQKINEMKEQMLKDKHCYGVAMLRDRLYLVYLDVNSVYVHRNDPPLDFIEEVQIKGMGKYGPYEIVASSAHDRCYIRTRNKIWYLLNGSQTSEVFLESEDIRSIWSMSITAKGQLLVAYGGGKLAFYNLNGECIFHHDYKGKECCAVETKEGIVIYATTYYERIVAIYERSANGSVSRYYESRDRKGSEYYCSGITLGDDGQVFMLDRERNQILLYDYKVHQLRPLLTKDDHELSWIIRICYIKEKKQLLLCGIGVIVFFQLTQAAPTKVSREVSISADSSEVKTNLNTTFDTGDEARLQMAAQSSMQQQTTSVCENVSVVFQTGSDGNGFSSFDLPVTQIIGSNGEQMFIPQILSQVPTVTEQQQPYSSFQDNSNYGDIHAIDHTFKPNSLHDDVTMEATVASQNDKKRKNFFDSEDQNAKSKVYHMGMKVMPSNSGINGEDDDHDVARFMTSLQTLDHPHDSAVPVADNVAYSGPLTMGQLPQHSGFSSQVVSSSNINFAPSDTFPQVYLNAVPQNYTFMNPTFGASAPNFDIPLGQQIFIQTPASYPMINNQLIPIDAAMLQMQFASESQISELADQDNESMSIDEESIEDPKAVNIGELRCNRKDSNGLAVLNGRLYIITKCSKTILVYSSRSPFEEMKSLKVEGMKTPHQIYASSKKGCLFILDGEDDSSLKCIWSVKDSNEFSYKKLITDANCYKFCLTRDENLLVLGRNSFCFHFYESENGRCFRCIHLSDILKNEFGEPHYVVCSQDNGFYISWTNNNSKTSQISKLSDDGNLLNTFGVRSGKEIGQLSFCHLPMALDKYGRLIVFDLENYRVLLLNSDLDYITTLLDKKDLHYQEGFGMCLDDTESILFTARRHHRIDAFSFMQFEPERLNKLYQQKSLRTYRDDSTVIMVGNISTTGDNIRGVAVLFSQIYLLTSNSILVHSDRNPYKRIYKESYYGVDFWDIAADDSSSGRLYVTDRKNHCIWLIGIVLGRTKWLQHIGSPYTLSVAKDGSVVIPNIKEQSIDIFEGKTAKLLQRISLKANLNRIKIRHAIRLPHAYVVCHGCPKEEFDDDDDDYAKNEVILVLLNGDVSSTYGDKSVLPNHLAIRRGDILVADGKNKRVLRLNHQLQLKNVLISNEKQGIDEPQRLFYERNSDRLFVLNSQSVDIFTFNFVNQKLTDDNDQTSEINTLDLDQDDCSFELPKFQKINEMKDKMLEDNWCKGVAMLRDRIYLIYYRVNSVYVHRSDPPFYLIEKVQIEGLNEYDVWDIVASSAHDLCYIGTLKKIWYLLNGSQTVEVFLESEKDIRSMSIAAEGHLLVVYLDGKVASYNSDGECTECIFLSHYKYNLDCCAVKTNERKIVYTTSGNDNNLKYIYERSANGTVSCCFGPFLWVYSGYSCFRITLGDDEQVFMLDRERNQILLYDYKAHQLRPLLTKDDHQLSQIQRFCYIKEKTQLLLCGNGVIVFFQLSQNGQSEQSCESLESLSSQQIPSKGEKKTRLLYGIVVDFDESDSSRGVARLENKTYLLMNSELLIVNSKDIRTKEFHPWRHSLKIPDDHLGLKVGGLRDIAASPIDLCIYITDKKNRCVWSVTVDHKIKKWLNDIDSPYTLSVNDDGCVCMLSNYYRHLDIYDANGIRRKSIRLPRFMNYLSHAIQTPTGNYLICWNKKDLNENDDEDDDDSDDDSDDYDDSEDNKKESQIRKPLKASISEDVLNSLLYEISPDGNVIRTFSTTQSTPSSQLVEPQHLAIDSDGRVFVTDYRSYNNAIKLFDCQLKFIENLTESLNPYPGLFPRAICYDNHAKELLVIVKDEALYLNFLICFKI